MSHKRPKIQSGQVDAVQALNNKRNELVAAQNELGQLGRHSDSQRAVELRSRIAQLETEIATDEANTTSIRDTATEYHVDPARNMTEGPHDA